jgi:Tfp pilus assembly protein PilX
VTTHDHDRDRGQILPLVLAFIVFSGLITTAIMSLTITSFRASTELQEQRNERYTAASAVDTMVEYFRNDDQIGKTAGSVSSTTLTLNGAEVTVTGTNTGAATIGRDLDLTASVNGETVLTAEVFIDAGADPDVFVNSWTYD